MHQFSLRPVYQANLYQIKQTQAILESSWFLTQKKKKVWNFTLGGGWFRTKLGHFQTFFYFFFIHVLKTKSVKVHFSLFFEWDLPLANSIGFQIWQRFVGKKTKTLGKEWKGGSKIIEEGSYSPQWTKWLDLTWPLHSQNLFYRGHMTLTWAKIKCSSKKFLRCKISSHLVHGGLSYSPPPCWVHSLCSPPFPVQYVLLCV